MRIFENEFDLYELVEKNRFVIFILKLLKNTLVLLIINDDSHKKF